MKYKIIPKGETAMIIDDANDANEAMAAFATKMDLDMNRYFRAVRLDPERRCGNCEWRMVEGMFGTEPCGGYEMTETVEDEIDRASECSNYTKGDPESERDYCPSATAGDYSPSSPWNAPGCSVNMFI